MFPLRRDRSQLRSNSASLRCFLPRVRSASLRRSQLRARSAGIHCCLSSMGSTVANVGRSPPLPMADKVGRSLPLLAEDKADRYPPLSGCTLPLSAMDTKMIYEDNRTNFYFNTFRTAVLTAGFRALFIIDHPRFALAIFVCVTTSFTATVPYRTWNAWALMKEVIPQAETTEKEVVTQAEVV